MIKKYDVFSGLYGLAVGDALGVPVEFMPRKKLDADPVTDMRAYGSHKQPKGTWSDDTSMTLATMDAVRYNWVSTGRMMDCFYRWLEKGYYTADGTVFDVGGTCNRAIYNYSIGMPLEKCGATDERSNGNGSLMRMLPMIYFVDYAFGVEINDRAVHYIYEVSSVTHAHIISKVCCVFYVYLGVYLLRYRNRRSVQEIIKKAILDVNEYYKDATEGWEVVKEISFYRATEAPRKDVRSSGYVVDSLEASIWCLFNSSSYKEAVLLAVNLGEDTDTIGAITGSLAGLYYGFKAIPKEWKEALRNKKLLNEVGNRFYNENK